MNNESLLNILRKRLSAARLGHSLCVANSAVLLARHYGADEKKARFAGLAHDICKCGGVEEMSALYSPRLDCELGNKKLLHAPAGAVLLQNLGVSDEEILNAVRYHTTGRANMSLLEKIVFTADLISTDRDYRDLNAVRELAFCGIDAAMVYILNYVIAKLRSENLAVHPNSLECRQALENLGYNV
ncbi:MAG: bis(5'-nucleosyl)-tetraphosphatase (symmetrical) YqeK [Oscillospiraceae bacterium]|nr:bis(5'-nucleosyl)-tetraphosphatase (symmetrical) YqeK [Oscillospiraceae bacterium]